MECFPLSFPGDLMKDFPAFASLSPSNGIKKEESPPSSLSSVPSVPIIPKDIRQHSSTSLGIHVSGRLLSPKLSSGNRTAEIAAMESETPIASDNKMYFARYGGEIQLTQYMHRMDTVRNNARPTGRCEQIEKCYYWKEQDDLVGGLIDVKTEVTAAGFNLTCGLVDEYKEGSTESEQTQHAEYQSRLDDVCRQFSLESVMETLVEDYFTCDSMILYWSVDVSTTDGGSVSSDYAPISTGKEVLPGVKNICALRPCDVDWRNSLGMDTLSIIIPEDILKLIRLVLLQPPAAREREIQKLLANGVPQKYIDAVAGGSKYVQLTHEEGDYWIIYTRHRKFHGFCTPSMFRVFLQIEIRQCFSDADFSGAFMAKHFIQHIKMGESIDQGPKAGMKDNWAKKKDTDDMMKHIANNASAMHLVTDHTVEIAFVFPPADMFSEARYQACDGRIYKWSGISADIYGSGGGGKYAGGYLSIRRAVSNCGKARRKVSCMFREFFEHETIRDRIKTPDGVYALMGFDENVLKEPRQLLDEIKFLFEQGMGDPITTLREVGRNPGAIRRSKMAAKKDNTTNKTWEPIYVVAPRGISTGKNQTSAGRPAAVGTTKSEETRTQRPSVS